MNNRKADATVIDYGAIPQSVGEWEIAPAWMLPRAQMLQAQRIIRLAFFRHDRP